MFTRHTTMVVGPTGSGKTAVINAYRHIENAQCFYINPKSITTNELYGTMDI
jgi:dynein heavy chain